jgi:hypothetical protein
MDTTKRPLYRSLYFQVVVAIVIGVLLGHFYPDTGAAMKPLGDGFIKLIKMIIAPIIFCTVVVGIAGMEDMKKVGKTGGYALLYFEIVSTIALIVGLTIVNVVQPGVGMNIDPATLDTKAVAAYTKPGQMQNTQEFLLNIIPNTIVDAFAKGEILQVLLFSVMFGFGGEQSLDRYLAISARGLPFNIAHAAGNAALALVAGPAFESGDFRNPDIAWLDQAVVGVDALVWRSGWDQWQVIRDAFATNRAAAAVTPGANSTPNEVPARGSIESPALVSQGVGKRRYRSKNQFSLTASLCLLGLVALLFVVLLFVFFKRPQPAPIPNAEIPTGASTN